MKKLVISLILSFYALGATAGWEAQVQAQALPKLKKIFSVWDLLYKDVCTAPRLGCNFYYADDRGGEVSKVWVATWDFGDKFSRQISEALETNKALFDFKYQSVEYYNSWSEVDGAGGFLLFDSQKILSPFGTKLEPHSSYEKRDEILAEMLLPQTSPEKIYEESFLRAEDAARTYALNTNSDVTSIRKLTLALQNFALIPVKEKRGRTSDDIDAMYNLIKDLN